MKPGRPYGAIAVRVAMWFAVLSCLAASLCAQEVTAPRHTGVSQDWSQHHIVFTRDGLARHPELIYREPRVLQQAMQRWQVPNFGVFESPESAAAPDNAGPHSDWNLTNFGGHVVLSAYPSKYSFNPAFSPDCTKDYVVFGLNTVSTGNQANLVALNNLYVNPAGTGFCAGTKPTVMFAYDITTQGGHVITSPVISEDGLKIAFIESVAGGGSIFHVLTWSTPAGVIGGAVVPTNWVSITLPGATNDATSSPWVDYYSDTAYVGSANGLIYKITGVFRGTPTLAGAPWPVTVGASSALTSPVLDSNLGMLMVGAANGRLYQVNIGNGAVAHVNIGTGFHHNIVAAPIVDVANGITFVVSPDSTLAGPASAVLAEVNTLTLHVLAAANIGQGSSGGVTAVDLYQPALDHNYYNNPSTGSINLCGTGPGDTSPWQYAFGFTVPVTQPIMTTTASIAQALPTNPANSVNARCTGWTEFFNPNIVTGATDFFFFGLTVDCTAPGAAGGCVEEIAVNGGIPTLTTKNIIGGGATGIVIDNYSTAPEASSIYFTSRQANTAYKMTQNGLN